MVRTDDEVDLKVAVSIVTAAEAHRVSAVFPKSPTAYQLPVAANGDGAWIVDSENRRYLDGSGGVFVANLGHSPASVGQPLRHFVVLRWQVRFQE